MKKIACLTDFSEEAYNGVLFANSVARAISAKLILFHAYMPEETGKEFHPSLTEHSDTESRDLLYKMCLDMRLKDRHTDVSVEYMIKEGSPTARINEAIIKDGIDLIIMSAEGALKENDTYYGTILSDILLNAKCPVLVIPKACEYKGINNIVYAFDIEKENSLEESAISFARRFGANLDVLSFVNTEDENETDKVYAKFSEIKIKSSYDKVSFDLKLAANIISEMGKFIVDRNSDMIILENHRRTPYKRLTEPSFSKSFVFMSKKPVLVIRSKED